MGDRSLAAGSTGHPRFAGDHDCDPVFHAEDDAQPGHGSFAGEDDAVYAAHVRLLLLQYVERPSVILANWQFGRNCAAGGHKPYRSAAQYRATENLAREKEAQGLNVSGREEVYGQFVTPANSTVPGHADSRRGL